MGDMAKIIGYTIISIILFAIPTAAILSFLYEWGALYQYTLITITVLEFVSFEYALYVFFEKLGV